MYVFLAPKKINFHWRFAINFQRLLTVKFIILSAYGFDHNSPELINIFVSGLLQPYIISIYLWVFLKDQSVVLIILYTYTCVIFMQKILSFNKIWQCSPYKCWGDQPSSRKYEELLGILINHKCTFEDQLLNIVRKINREYQSTCLKRSWQFAYCSLIWIIHSRKINHDKFR